MLYLLRSGFRKDLIIHLLIVVILGSGVAMAAGYLADNYFGQTVSGLIGDYGEFDLLLTVNREARDSALSQIRDILRVKLPGSRVEQGVSIAGSTNFFLQLDKKYRTREHFMKIDNYFSNVSGLVGVTVMSEPRVTVRSIPRKLQDQFEQEMQKIPGVKFTYPASGGIDLMLDSPKDIDTVNQKVKELLNQYKILEVRFPIDNGPADVTTVGDHLTERLKEKYNLSTAQNLTTNEVDDQQYLVTTMREMKNFLFQYASVVTIPLPAAEDMILRQDDYLIMPGPGRSGLKPGDEITPMDLKLQIVEVTETEAKALIVEGNVTDIGSREVYQMNKDGKVAGLIGQADVKSPREDLKYAADELAAILPDLDKIFKNLYGMTDEALTALEIYSDTLVEINEVKTALEAGQEKVADVRDQLGQVDLTKVQDFVFNLLQVVSTAEEVMSKMEWAQEEFVQIDNQLGQFQGQVQVLKEEFGVSESYGKELDDAVQIAATLQDTLQNNTGELIQRINDYNPLLSKISGWRQDLEKLGQMVKSGDLLSEDTNAVTGILDRLVSSSQTTLEYLGRLDDAKMNQEINGFKNSLQKVQEADVSAIIEELNYISDTLPKLRDEEVSHTIKLIDRYMTGQIIPGEQILILVPGDFPIKQTQQFVMEVVGQSTISVFEMDAGNLQPNVRGQFLRVISQVRETITAMVAVVIVLLVLMLDLTSVMSVVKDLRYRKNQSLIWRILNSEILLGIFCGSLTLELIFRITGGQLPYIESHPGAWIGAVLGLIIGLLADRINPLDRQEYMAGEALGFNLTEILREIIIPASKPGLLLVLNRRNLVFK